MELVSRFFLIFPFIKGNGFKTKLKEKVDFFIKMGIFMWENGKGEREMGKASTKVQTVQLMMESGLMTYDKAKPSKRGQMEANMKGTLT